MARYRPPDRLDLAVPNWAVWRTAFQSYRFETRLDREPHDIQVSTLLYCMGPQAAQVASTFDYDSENNSSPAPSYDSLLQQFDNYFSSPRLNVVRLRRQFHRRLQGRDEGIGAFHTALQMAAKNCEFLDTRDRILDQFVCGLRNEKMACGLEHLFLSSPLDFTLDSVLAWCKAYKEPATTTGHRTTPPTTMTTTETANTVIMNKNTIERSEVPDFGRGVTDISGNRSNSCDDISNSNNTAIKSRINMISKDNRRHSSINILNTNTSNKTSDPAGTSAVPEKKKTSTSQHMVLCSTCGSNTHICGSLRCPAYNSTCVTCNLPKHVHSKPCRPRAVTNRNRNNTSYFEPHQLPVTYSPHSRNSLDSMLAKLATPIDKSTNIH